MPSTSDIVARASDALFGRALVNNVARAALVEAMISAVLDARWSWCSGDWSECDFRHDSGARLEVKQSAAIQSWHLKADRPSTPRFGVAPKFAWSRQAGWASTPMRNAEIFVFALHAIADLDRADHREADQWLFHVVAADSLPPRVKTVGLKAVTKIARSVPLAEVAGAVETVRTRL